MPACQNVKIMKRGTLALSPMGNPIDASIEAILFWKGEPMTLPELCRDLGGVSPDAVASALELLKGKLAGRGIVLIQNGETVALAATPDAHELIENLRREELSRDLGKADLKRSLSCFTEAR